MTRLQTGIVAGVLAIFGVVLWHNRQDEHAAAEIRAALDSAAVATTRATNALAVSAQQKALSDSLATVAAQAEDDAHDATRAANRLRAERLRLLALVTTADSASPPADTSALARANTALDLSVAESDSLRVAITHHEAAEATKDQQITALVVAVDTSAQALTQARGVITQQSAVLRTMEPRCKIGPLPCPSRKLVAVGTTLATVLALR